MGKITVQNLGKAYKKYANKYMRLAEAVLPISRSLHSTHWVLRDINFIVEPGQAVGIIGINGAGKSTLLKMLVGTIKPTTGSVHVSGRVAALLELGMGFHPDFTGRQNIIMAGQLLGYSTEEVTDLMPSIEAFAEIGDYIDQPVRIYSSGMQVRLAFSVATAIRPDILIVDEALSVGDAYFQHKSFDRIREYRNNGTTLLMVSHDKATIQSICDRAILLNGGHIEMEGPPEEVMDFYNAMLADKEALNIRQSASHDGRIQTQSGTGHVRIESVVLFDEKGGSIEIAEVGQIVILRVAVKAIYAVSELAVGFLIKDKLGQSIFGSNSHHMSRNNISMNAGELKTFTFEFPANLGNGSYSIAVALHGGATHLQKNYEWRDLAVIFDVKNFSQIHFIGSTWLPVTLGVE